jgi:carbonic anhydrase
MGRGPSRHTGVAAWPPQCSDHPPRCASWSRELQHYLFRGKGYEFALRVRPETTELAMPMPPTLLAGYQRFRQERFVLEAQRFRTLAQGQNPRTMIIGCADSRVDPATIFAAAPGELFVLRNIAALVPPCEETGTFHGTSAAVEFAVTVLKVETILVMGHGMCGGIAAALAEADDQPVGRFIKPWVGLIGARRDEMLERGTIREPQERQRALEHLAIQESLHNLTTFPFVAEEIAQGRLQLHGAWFSIADAELQWLNRNTGEFEAIKVSD